MHPTLRDQFQRARTVIQSLVQGVDPETGDELPKNSIVNRIEVNRALSTGILAIDQIAARLVRRAQLPESVGKTWTEDEEQVLTDEFNAGDPTSLMATKHRRTIRAIEARLEKLGLITAGQRATSGSFVETSRTQKEEGGK